MKTQFKNPIQVGDLVKKLEVKQAFCGVTGKTKTVPEVLFLQVIKIYKCGSHYRLTAEKTEMTIPTNCHQVDANIKAFEKMI